jgi:predicted O-linked N-acetylglucosamine transferase (SPINDLY family)
LIFAPRTTSASHLERQQHADLFLDTLPYNAHTTTSDALWMGLPVLTCKGETFSARVAASILASVHLSELVCISLQTYEEKALHLATHSTALTEIKETLKNQIRHSDLFNSEKFARTLEKQYKQVWHAYLTGADTSS